MSASASTTSITYLRTGERVADDGPAPRAAGDRPRRSRHRRVPRRVRTRRRRAAAPVARRSPTRSSPATRCRRCGPTPRDMDLAAWPLAAGSGHPPAHRGHVRARPAAVAAGGRAAHRGRPSRDVAPCRGARGRGPRDAPQGSCPGRHGRRSRRVRRGARDRPGDLRRLHAPVVRHRPRDRRRDVRGARRRARAGRPPGRPVRASPR